MDATGQIFQISKFPNTLSIPIIPGMFRRNLTKICQIYIPFNFAKSGCIPPKIKWEILAPNGSQTTRATPGDYLASWNRKPIKQRDLLASLTMDKYFRGKVTHCRHFFLTSIAQWSVEEDETIMTIMYGKFWFDGDFFGRYLDASVKLR